MSRRSCGKRGSGKEILVIIIILILCCGIDCGGFGKDC
ncbi:hypothetical protein CLLU_17050 [Clostridium luticellarii]|jgi:hypothetical protein|uniref:Uncharacterized protein n=1 Tax=Clostridium luticellarii TaxID=1691940 RepID=A0A2T0BN77_9CLOT|nr:hypothetical protein CLLU_17050 [Clostridium luticellarii]